MNNSTCTSKTSTVNTHDDVKIAPVTPYNTNHHHHNNTPLPSSKQVQVSDETVPMSIASLSEQTTLNDINTVGYNNCNYNSNSNSNTPSNHHYFFGADLVRNANGTPLLDHHQNTIPIAKMLATKPLRHELATRPGPGNKKLTYLSGESVTRTLNDIFGFDGWCLEVKETKRESCDKDAKGRFIVSYTSKVRVTHRISGAFKEDVGAGDAMDKSLGTAVSNALKGSVTDAMKRAARHFGDKLGNSLYGSDFTIHNAPKTLTDALNQYDLERAKFKFGFEKEKKPMTNHNQSSATISASVSTSSTSSTTTNQNKSTSNKNVKSEGNCNTSTLIIHNSTNHIHNNNINDSNNSNNSNNNNSKNGDKTHHTKIQQQANDQYQPQQKAMNTNTLYPHNNNNNNTQQFDVKQQGYVSNSTILQAPSSGGGLSRFQQQPPSSSNMSIGHNQGVSTNMNNKHNIQHRPLCDLQFPKSTLIDQSPSIQPNNISATSYLKSSDLSSSSSIATRHNHGPLTTLPTTNINNTTSSSLLERPMTAHNGYPTNNTNHYHVMANNNNNNSSKIMIESSKENLNCNGKRTLIVSSSSTTKNSMCNTNQLQAAHHQGVGVVKKAMNPYAVKRP